MIGLGGSEEIRRVASMKLDVLFCDGRHASLIAALAVGLGIGAVTQSVAAPAPSEEVSSADQSEQSSSTIDQSEQSISAIDQSEQSISTIDQSEQGCSPIDQNEPITSTDMIDAAFVEDLKTWLDVRVVRMTLKDRNEENADLLPEAVLNADQQWRAETKSNDQPLITAVLNSPLSSYLLRVQAGSLGLYSEIFVMDAKGLNAGQSAITSDYWQGDEAKFQKTYDVGPSAVFIDAAEYHSETDTWRAQVNLTLTDEKGASIGAATVELNLTELKRRRADHMAAGI